MRQSVRDAWVKFNAPNEGVLGYPYTDAKGLVTTGMGNLEDSPVALIAAGTWRHAPGKDFADGDEPIATADEVSAAWSVVKNAWPNVQSTASKGLTDIRLTRADVDALVRRTLDATWADLLKDFPDADYWPADGQMGLASDGWAMGGAFARVYGFKSLMAALNASPLPRFADAAPPLALAHFKGVGVQGRIAQNDVCWKNADAVQAKGLDYDRLWWPASVPPDAEPDGSGPGPLFAVAVILLGLAGWAAWQLWKGA